MAEEKLTVWARTQVVASAVRKSVRRRVREWWLSTEPPGRADEWRGLITHAYKRRDLARRVATDLGLQADLDFTGFVKLHRRLVWDDVIARRWSMVIGIPCVVGFFVASYLMARYFDQPGAGLSAIFGILGIVPVWLALGAVLMFCRWFLRTGLLVAFLFAASLEAAAGLVVYGEITGMEPVHSIVHRAADHRGWYTLMHGTLLFAGIMALVLVLSPVIAIVARRRTRRNPVANAIDALLDCVWLAHDEQEFMLLSTRRLLVTHTRRVARILEHGLWRVSWVNSPLASRELRRRCEHAGQSVEIMCRQLALPDRTTHKAYLEQVLRLADTLISGRLGELPDDPERAAFAVRSKLARAGRFALGFAVGVLPLALYIPFHRMLPESAWTPMFALCVAWFAGFIQLPNVLSMWANAK